MFDDVDVNEVLGSRGEEREEKPDKAREELVVAAEAVLDVLDPYGAPSPEREPEKNETPIQRQQRLIERRASLEKRRAKAELLNDALEDWYTLRESLPHKEAKHEEDEGEADDFDLDGE